MLPFDIRHPSRDAVFNLHGKWQPVADLKAADLAVVNATDVFEKLRHRFLYFEVGGFGRPGFSLPKLENLHRGWPRIQYQRATANLDTFQMAEGQLP